MMALPVRWWLSSGVRHFGEGFIYCLSSRPEENGTAMVGAEEGPSTNRTNARESVSVMDPGRTWELARVKAGSDLMQYDKL
jgi:hypothetical protein